MAGVVSAMVPVVGPVTQYSILTALGHGAATLEDTVGTYVVRSRILPCALTGLCVPW